MATNSVVALPIERTLASNGDVRLLIRIDEGGEVHTFHPFPASVDNRVLPGIS